MDMNAIDRLVETHVFGVDLTAHDDQSIADAVFSGFRGSDGCGGAEVEWNGNQHALRFVGVCGGTAKGNSAYGLNWWHVRHEKPWQADIEAHVAAWRATPPPRSTSIAAAWQVVEKMKAYGWAVNIYSGNGSQCWEAEFGHPSDRSRDAGSETSPLPLAICLAALRAKGIEVQA